LPARNISRTASFDGFDHRDDIRRVDLCNLERSQTWQNIGIESPPRRVHMASALPIPPVFQPLGGDACEGIFVRDLIGGLCDFADRHRVSPGRQQLFGLKVALPGEREGHRWILPEGHQLFSTVESVRPPPKLAA